MVNTFSVSIHFLKRGCINKSSSSSCHTASTDLLDPPLSLVSIGHCSRRVFKAIFCIGTELLHIGSSWSFCLCSSICRGPKEYIAYEYVLMSPAVSHMSRSSNFDSFRDGWLVAVQMLFCGVLPPGIVQYCSRLLVRHVQNVTQGQFLRFCIETWLTQLGNSSTVHVA